MQSDSGANTSAIAQYPHNDAGAATGQHASSVESIVQSFEEADHNQHVDLSGYAFEDWLCLGLFWVMGALVFMQFFTRYVMNDSLAWTEELAVYALIGVVFLGAAMCVRICRHIQVDFMYRYLPKEVARVLATMIDVIRTVFFGYLVILGYRYIELVGVEPMTTIMWNKSYVYWLAEAGFVMMFVRSIQVSVQNWRQGYSSLENPAAYQSLD